MLAAALCGAAQAQVYKCEAAGGRVTYQSQPCGSGGGRQVPLRADPVPVEAHGAADCAALRSSMDEMTEDRRRIDRELRATERSGDGAAPVLRSYRSRLAGIDENIASLKQRMGHVGCMQGSPPSAPPAAREGPAYTGGSIEVHQCQRLKHAIDAEYATIEHRVRSRRQSDPVAEAHVGGMTRAWDDQAASASQQKIVEYIRRGDEAGCRRLGVYVGPSAAHTSIGLARECRKLEDNYLSHRNRVTRHGASAQDAADAGAELRRIEVEMKRYDCTPPR